MREWTNEDGDVERWTLHFTDAGFGYTFSAGDHHFQMGGLTWTDDPEHGVIRGVLAAVSHSDLQWWVGQTVQFAYVPAGEAGRINFSLWFHEQEVQGEGDARQWVAPSSYSPYGDFWHGFERVGSAP